MIRELKMQIRMNDPAFPVGDDNDDYKGLTKLELISLIALHALAQNPSRLLSPTGLSQSAIAIAKAHIRELNLETSGTGEENV